MENTPYFSVIVPVYNVERYVKICLQSILAQTFQDFELIIIDDESPDNSYDVCHELIKDNKKVRIIRHEKNQGLGGARNTGIKNALGKYIFFVDSDDLILPDALQKLYNVSKKFDADIIRTLLRYEVFQDDDKPINTRNMRLVEEKKPEGFLKDDLVYRLVNFCIKDRIQYMAWLALYKREFLLKNNLLFPSCIYEDQPFSFRALCIAKRYLMIHEPLNVFRYREGSIQHSKNLKNFSKAVESMRITAELVSNTLSEFPEFQGKQTLMYQCLASMFEPIMAAQILPLYDGTVSFEELDNTTDKALSPIFGNNTVLAKFWINGFSSMWRQANILSIQNQHMQKELNFLAQSRNNFFVDTVKLLRNCAISSNKIVFVNFNGRGYGCNPKYIAQEILRQNLNYDLVWLVNNMNETMPEKIRKVQFNSAGAVYELSTAKVIISNTKLQLPFIKKQGQFFIMTWHGDYWVKYVEKDTEDQLSKEYVINSKQNSAITDLIPSSSKLQTEEIRRAYWYNGEIIECGLPRNDIFFKSSEELINNLKRRLNIPVENKILLYAPTFRNDIPTSVNAYKFNQGKILEVIRKKFKGEWSLLLRFHPNVSGAGFAQNLYRLSSNVIDVTNYPDPQEIILISDVLISDYSSVIYNFMISRKPAFIFAKDAKTYPKERRIKPLFYELPFDINETEDELFDCIENFDMTKFNARVDKFLSRINSYDDGHASERIVTVIKNVVNV